MPAKSKAQRQAAAIAEHNPEQLYARNKGMVSMSQEELHKLASTSEKGLPQKAKKRVRHSPEMSEINRHSQHTVDGKCMEHGTY